VVDDSGAGSGIAVGYSGTVAGVVGDNVFAVVFINAGDGDYFVGGFCIGDRLYFLMLMLV
jgi:hypothetical protein